MMIYKFRHKEQDFEIDLYDHRDLLTLWYKDYHHNFYEVDMLDYISTLGPQKTILDIGANVGNHAMYFQRFIKYNNLICFEPHQENFNKLCNNLDFRKNAVAYKIALGNSNKRTGLIDNYNNRGNVSIKDGNDTPMYKIDDLNVNDVTLMKIDVESYELEVLKGSAKTLEEYKPRIFVELWKNKKDEVFEFLNTFGYKYVQTFTTDGIDVYEFVF